MLKQVWICECDVCGHIEPAKFLLGRYHDTDYTYPDDWKKGRNSEILICPECAKKLEL